VTAAGRGSAPCAPASPLALLPVVPPASALWSRCDYRSRSCAETATRELNAAFLTVMLEGRYTDAYLASAGSDAPRFTDQELAAIGSPVDFAGINVHRPNVYVAPSDTPPGYRTIPVSASHPKMASSWHIFDSEVMHWAPRQVTSIWGPKAIFITENGCAAADQLSDDGNVYDSDRVMFLRACLGQLQRATAEGVPVRGYFHWSAQDNLEWLSGFGDRFGLIYVDFDTLERTPSSARNGSGRPPGRTRSSRAARRTPRQDRQPRAGHWVARTTGRAMARSR